VRAQGELPVDKASRASLWMPVAKMGCGAAASITAQLVTYPLDTVRRRLQQNGAVVRARQGFRVDLALTLTPTLALTLALNCRLKLPLTPYPYPNPCLNPYLP